MLVGLLALLPAAAEAKRATPFGARVLKQGTSGKDVKTLQGYLTRLGHVTTIDGQFGKGTKRSVRAWETEATRLVDGRVSKADARALVAQVAKPVAAPTEEPVDDATTGGTTFSETSLAPTARATLNPDGTATAPADAPQAVKDMIAAGNEIAFKPYVYGGGHGKWKDRGYDCSGSVSYALHGAGLLATSMDSSSLESYGQPGPGSWVTIYANSGHTYMLVAGLRFDTSAAKAQSNGSRWTDEARRNDGYVVRHPPGL